MLFAVCIACVAMLAGCGDKVTDAYITKSDMPRTNYVQGQDLDLSKGLLTVILNGEEAKMPFTAEGVSVTGYDKDLLGAQTVTVTYAEQTATFSVNVVPRIVAENYETKYFVDDLFNKNVGKLKIAKDDASVFSVNMNDERVSLVSFDPVVGTQTVTVRYTDKGVSYDCSFKVTVYEVADVKFTAPSRTDYKSHETAPDVTGGFFTITSTDGKLTKNVPLAAAMIPEFDLSGATMDHRTTPYETKLTVSYLTKNFELPVTVTFSDVSVVNYYLKETLGSIDLNKKMTEEQQAAAWDAILAYYNLTVEERLTFSSADTETVVRAGTLAARTVFSEAMKDCADTFTMDKTGSLGLQSGTYEEAVEDLAKVHDPKSELNLSKEVLRKLITDFPAVMLGDADCVGLTLVYSVEMETLLTEVLDHLVTIYEPFAKIPENWTVESLAEYGDGIVASALQMYNAGYYQQGLTFYSDIVAKWRGEKEDFLEILYSYILYEHEDGVNFMKNYMFTYLPMPGLLEDWYTCFYTAYRLERQYAAYYNSEAFMTDVSQYMYFYFLTFEFGDTIKGSGDKLLIDIYNAYDLDLIVTRYLTLYNFGYNYHSKAVLDSGNYKLLWQKYYTLLKLQVTNKLSAEEHKMFICDMYATFADMSPSELFGFLSSLNLMYGQARGAILVLQYTDEGVYNVFTAILRDYYMTYMSDDVKPLFRKLLLAMENYALVGQKEDAIAEFKTLMEEIADGYKVLSDDDKANFREFCGTSWDKYGMIYDQIAGTITLTPTAEERAKIDELKAAMDRYFKVYSDLLNMKETTADQLVLLHALYAKVDVLYKDLMKDASNPVLATLFTEIYTAFEVEYTVDKAYYLADHLSTTLMLSNSATITDEKGKTSYVTSWDLFCDNGFAALYAKMADLLYYSYVDNTATPDEKQVMELMLEVRALDDYKLRVFSFLGANTAYFMSENAYIKGMLEGEAVAETLVDNMTNAQIAYINYLLNGKDNTYLADFLNLFLKIQTDYGTLTEEHKTALAELYGYYTDLYNKAVGGFTPTPDPEEKPGLEEKPELEEKPKLDVEDITPVNP